MIKKGINFRISVIFVPHKLQRFSIHILSNYDTCTSHIISLLMNSSNGINIFNIERKNTEMIQAKLCGGYSIFY